MILQSIPSLEVHEALLEEIKETIFICLPLSLVKAIGLLKKRYDLLIQKFFINSFKLLDATGKPIPQPSDYDL